MGGCVSDRNGQVSSYFIVKWISGYVALESMYSNKRYMSYKEKELLVSASGNEELY